MKAVIFCSDDNTDLQPMTNTVIKAMLPVCGKASVKYVLDAVNNYDITQAFIVNDSSQENLKQLFQSGSFKNVVVDFLTVSEISEYDFSEEILFISDISLFDFNLNEALSNHQESGCFATLIVKHENNARNIEGVITDKNGHVQTIMSRKYNSNVLGNPISTGIWIVSSSDTKKFLNEFIQKGKISPKDFNINSYTDSGYWCRINSVADYLKCHKDVLSLKAPFEFSSHKMLNGIYTSDLHDYELNANISAPAYIGKNVSIGNGAVIESNSVIGDNVTIGKNVKLHGCVIMNGVYIGDRVECNDCIICKNATLLNSCTVNEDCIIGEGAVIGENAVVKCGVKVWNEKHLERNTTADFDIHYGHGRHLHIGEDGIYGETNGEMSAIIAVKTGISLVNAGKNIAVGYKADKNAAHSSAMAVCAGITSAGGNALFVGECIENELAFITAECGQDLGVYIESNSVTKIKLISSDGLTLDECCENAIECGLNGSTVSRAPYFSFGEIAYSSQLRKLYEIELSRHVHGCTNYDIEISTSNKDIKKICNKLITENTNAKEKIIFQISADGKKASAFTEETGFVFNEKLIAICCRKLFESGQDVALPYSFSLSIDEIATQYDRKVLRYGDCITDINIRKLAGKQRFTNDGIMLALEIIGIISDENKTLSELVSSLPKTFSVSRFISCRDNGMDFMNKLAMESNGLNRDGIWIKDKNGDVFMRPSKTGKSIMLYAESFSSETASEICSSYEKIILNKLC